MTWCSRSETMVQSKVGVRDVEKIVIFSTKARNELLLCSEEQAD